MRKSITLQQELGPVFDITFDCEDGAAAGNEAAHAQLVSSLIASTENRFNRIGARVHNLSHPAFEKDVAEICSAAAKKLAYLVIPKVENVEELKQAMSIVRKYASKAGRNDLPIHVLIETHGALNDVREIATLPEVECLSFGIMDFVSAHYGAIPGEAMRSPAQFEHPLVVRAKLEIAAAAHAYGKTPSHNVTTEITDTSVVTNDALRAKNALGYTRMWSIHPTQIKPILQAMAPSGEEVEEAAAILNQAQANHWGPIQFQGKLHDRASYRYYWTVLQRAKQAAMPLPNSSGSLL